MSLYYALSLLKENWDKSITYWCMESTVDPVTSDVKHHVIFAH